MLLGSVAVLGLGSAGSPSTPWSFVDSTAAVATSPVGATAGPSRAGECVLRSYRGAARSSPLQSAAGPAAVPRTEAAPAAGSDDGSGNLTVVIPPVVFIRPHGHWLVVTTNTGEPPQPQDAFYFVAPGRGRLAGPGLRQRVLTRCADRGGSGSPSPTPA
jgi:hypothetical protein